MNPLIFRKYDIRGLVNSDLNEETVEKIGKAFGTLILGKNKKDLILGCDVRTSSGRIRKTLVNAILSTGCNILDVGEVPISEYYFSIQNYGADGGVYITGSHNPPEYNGFKINIGNDSIFGDEIQQIVKIINSDKFSAGKGAIEFISPDKEYRNNIKNNIKSGKKLKIVVDCGNGVTSLFAPEILEELGCDVKRLYCEPDGTFPNHLPDPTIPENIEDLRSMVLKEKADFGVAYDGDGDRIGVVDDKGEILWGDRLLILFSRDILAKSPKSKILVEVKCSQSLIDDVELHGGIPVLCPTGHSLIKNEMKIQNALLAGEMSGHIFFADRYFGFDDAIYTTCRLVEILSNTDKKLSEMLNDAKKYISTPEIRIDCKDTEKFRIVDELKRYFEARNRTITIDGVRIIFDDGWALIRASNTEPKLILRFESETTQGLERIKNIVYTKIMEHNLTV
jgi:phosphomannomutase/phosphoglucomutase